MRVYDAQYGALRTSAYPWEHVAPAYRPVRFDAQVGDDLTAGPVKFSWDVVAHAKSADDDAGVGETETANLLGQNQTYIFRGPGTTYTLRLTAEFENEVRSATRFAVMCKYVRREVRDMSHADREAFFTALEIAHRADNIQQGRDTYGPRFTSVAALVAKHLDATTLNACSPFFNGLSFVTSHAALALELEQVLQTIDPSIALPYWDYTQDAAEYGGGGDWRTGGDLSRASGSAAARAAGPPRASGRFAYLPIASVGDQFSLAANGIATRAQRVRPADRRLQQRPVGVPHALELGVLAADEEPARPCAPGHARGARHAHVRAAPRALAPRRHLHAHRRRVDCRYSALDAMRAGRLHPQLIEAVDLKLPMLWRTMLERGPLACPTACNGRHLRGLLVLVPGLRPDRRALAVTGVRRRRERDRVRRALRQRLWIPRARRGHDDRDGLQYSVSGLSENGGNAFFKYLLSTLCHPGKLAPASSYHAAPNDRSSGSAREPDRVHKWMRANPDRRAARRRSTRHGTRPARPRRRACYHDGCRSRTYSTSTRRRLLNEQLQRIFHPHNPALPYVYDSFSWDHCSETVRPGLVETLSDAAGAVQTVAASSRR